MRILHLPVVAGRQAWGLSRAERAHGHSSDSIVFEQLFVKFPNDGVLFGPHDGVILQELKRWKLFLSSIFKYDVFHFHFGQKFFVLYARPWKSGDSFKQRLLRLAYWAYSQVVGRLDLWVLWLLGKKMFMTFHGDDIRQSDVARATQRVNVASEVDETYYDAYSDERKRRMANFYARYCREVFAVSPDLIKMSPRNTRHIRYTGVTPSEWVPKDTNNPRPLVVHAPSHRLAKGTRFVEAAVARLKELGYDFDFVLVEKMPNEQARAIYEKADLVVDQLLCGWYGVLALESMAMGKPVVAYIRPEDLKLVDPSLASELPIISAEPATIESVLAWCLEHPAELKKIGRDSRKFAEKWHDPIEIGREVVSFYERSSRSLSSRKAVLKTERKMTDS